MTVGGMGLIPERLLMMMMMMIHVGPTVTRILKKIPVMIKDLSLSGAISRHGSLALSKVRSADMYWPGIP